MNAVCVFLVLAGPSLFASPVTLQQDRLAGKLLDDWRADLNHSVAVRRRKAAESLSMLGDRARPLAVEIVEGLDDEDEMVRRHLATVVGKVSPPLDKAVRALVVMLANESDPSVQEAGLESLSSLDPDGEIVRTHAQAFKEVLLTGLDNTHRKTQRLFVEVAVALGPDASDAKDALLALAGLEQEMDAAILKFLRPIAAENSVALVTYAFESDNVAARLLALQVIKETGAIDGKSWLRLLSFAAEPSVNSRLRDESRELILKWGPKLKLSRVEQSEASRTIARGLRNVDTAVCSESFELLGLISPNDAAVLDALGALADRPDDALRRRAIDALARAGADSIPQLIALAGGGSNPEAKVLAVEAIARLGPKGVAAVPKLIANAKTAQDRRVRTVAARAVAKIDPNQTAAVLSSLLEHLDEDYPADLQESALDALARLGVRNAAALEKGVRSSHATVAAKAYRMWVTMEGTPSASRLLTNLVLSTKPDEFLRGARLVSLLSEAERSSFAHSETGEKAVEAILDLVADDAEQPNRRLSAIRNAARLCTGKETCSRLANLLLPCIKTKENSAVRLAAIVAGTAVKSTSTPELIDALKTAADSSDAFEALAASRSLKECTQIAVGPFEFAEFLSPETSVVAVVTFKGVVDRLLQRHNVDDQARRAVAAAMVRYAGPSLPIGADLLDRVTQVVAVADAVGETPVGFLVVKGRFDDLYVFGKVALKDERARAAFLDEKTLVVAPSEWVLDVVATRLKAPVGAGANLKEHMDRLKEHTLLSVVAVRTKAVKKPDDYISQLPSAALLQFRADLEAKLHFEVHTDDVGEWEGLAEAGLRALQDFAAGRTEPEWKGLIAACEKALRKSKDKTFSVTIEFPRDVVSLLVDRFRTMKLDS